MFKRLFTTKITKIANLNIPKNIDKFLVEEIPCTCVCQHSVFLIKEKSEIVNKNNNKNEKEYIKNYLVDI